MGKGQDGPSALAEAQIQVQNGLQAHVLQHNAVSGLLGKVRGKEELPAVRVHLIGYQSSRGRDEAVHHHATRWAAAPKMTPVERQFPVRLPCAAHPGAGWGQAGSLPGPV